MPWVAARETKFEEDKAYCLLGIFAVYLPLIYGEGEECNGQATFSMRAGVLALYTKILSLRKEEERKKHVCTTR